MLRIIKVTVSIVGKKKKDNIVDNTNNTHVQMDVSQPSTSESKILSIPRQAPPPLLTTRILSKWE